MLELRSIDTCMNATALIIVMLSCSKIDAKVPDVNTETMGSYNCREVSGDDGDANSVLAVAWEGARFSFKDRQKFINLFTQSISRLC